MKYFITLLFIALFTIHCSIETLDTYTVEEIDGVKHIHNSAPVTNEGSRPSLEFVRQWGNPENDDENYLLFKPYGVHIENDITYIFDVGNYCLKLYDADGKFIKSLGQKGEGPEDILTSSMYFKGRNGLLYLAGIFTRKIKIWDVEGNYLRSMDITVYDYGFEVLQSGSIISTYTEKGSNGLLSIYDPSGKAVLDIGQREDFGDPLSNKRGNNVNLTLDNEENIIISYVMFNRIEKYDTEGNLLWRTDRPISFDTESLPETAVGTRYNFDGSSQTIQSRNLPYLAAGIASDSKNRLWVMSMRREYNREVMNLEGPEFDVIEFDVFDENGILLAKIPATSYIGRLDIFGDRLFISDYHKTHTVYEYRIVDK
ncbi:DUF4934 domain-containing protein [candidate division KSB1 bacterium]